MCKKGGGGEATDLGGLLDMVADRQTAAVDTFYLCRFGNVTEPFDPFIVS